MCSYKLPLEEKTKTTLHRWYLKRASSIDDDEQEEEQAAWLDISVLLADQVTLARV